MAALRSDDPEQAPRPTPPHHAGGLLWLRRWSAAAGAPLAWARVEISPFQTLVIGSIAYGMDKLNCTT